MTKPRKRLAVSDYAAGILAHDRFVLSQAITLVESHLPSDQALAAEVLAAVVPQAGRAVRIGITGVPGVGKSTFIEAFGSLVTSQGKKLAVLAIDPSSQVSGGSIMGDKTRMERLSHDPLAYIRPSPAGSSLGGVSRKTREAMLLCEAAGHEVIFIETVGVGQSETAVHGMTDFFLLLMLAGAGDELQGIKKGIMEMADAVVINKADGDNALRARQAQKEYQTALHLFPASPSGWQAKVLTCSAREQTGLADIWQVIGQHQAQAQASGWFARRRQAQNLAWLHDTIRQQLEERFYQHPAVAQQLATVERAVADGSAHAVNAALALIGVYLGKG
jgi:LAO/AO transport system kinase